MWKDFIEWLSGIGHNLLGFITPLATLLAKSGGQVLVQAAEQEVAAAEAWAEGVIAGGGAATSDDKFVTAQTAIVANLKTQGIPVVMNAVNGAIEMAVAQMNSKPAAVAVPEPAVDAPVVDAAASNAAS